MHAGAEHVARLQHHRAKVTADADRHLLAIHPEFGVRGNLLLHLAGGIERVVGLREGRHHFIADGLDHRAVMLLGGGAHHVDADRDHGARFLVAKRLEQAGRADHVSEQNGEFDILDHAYSGWRR